MARKPLPASGSPVSPPIDLFLAIGGAAGCHQLASAFYARVARDSTLRPLFPGKTFRCAIEEFAAFLVQFLGGPPEDARHRWWLSLRESHLRFQIGKKERDAWMKLMTRTLDDVELSPSLRSALQSLFGDASAYLVNTGPAVATTNGQEEGSDIDAQISKRWEEQRALDEAVAAVREGETERVMAMVASPLLQSCFQRRAVMANFVGLLIGSSRPAITEYALTTLLENPDLAQERYSDRTLLHAAAAAGNLPMVTALLRLGVDANIADGGGHTPLYALGNQCAGGGAVVKVLVRAGAKVDACEGVKRCTALHMAARRDNVEAAEALLQCGANIEARDSSGETPLRRAVNCGQTGVARLLLEKGADRHSTGSKGLTPVTAARGKAIRELLRTAG